MHNWWAYPCRSQVSVWWVVGMSKFNYNSNKYIPKITVAHLMIFTGQSNCGFITETLCIIHYIAECKQCHGVVSYVGCQSGTSAMILNWFQLLILDVGHTKTYMAKGWLLMEKYLRNTDMSQIWSLNGEVCSAVL